MLNKQRHRMQINLSLRQLFFAEPTLYCVLLVITLFQIPAYAVENNNACLTDDDALINQQDKSKYPVVESKIKLLHKIVHDSATAQRIIDSENSKAIALLKITRETLAHSITLFDSGCIDASEQKLNDGLQLAQTASRYVVDNQRAAELSRQRYENLNERTTIFRDAYNRMLMDKDAETENSLDENRLLKLISSAEKLAQKNDYKQANIAMIKAVQMIENALTVALDKETLIHELKFDSIEEEYAYALETNRSYKKLLNMVLENLDESSPNHASMEKLVRGNEELLTEANANVASGKMEQALVIIDNGNITLIRTLSFTGLGQ